MKKDEIVEEVRRVRKQIEEAYPDDEMYWRHLLEIEEQFRDRLASRVPQAWPPIGEPVRKVAEPIAEWKPAHG
jgi:hypothetical protein